jgi:hypothetical protein
MKMVKWSLLIVSGGLLLQAGACVTDFAYLVLQGVATQVASDLVSQAAAAAG